jgi:hypothetical protein
MGKLSKLAATASLIIAVAGSAASAATTNNGSGSNNSQKSSNSSTSSVVCINNAVINNSSTTSATSGSANSSSNTGGSGSTQSGNASSSANVSVTVNGSCPKGTTAAPANSPAAKAAAAGQTNLKFDKTGNLLLPATGTSDTVKLGVVIAVAVALVATASQVALNLYRKAAIR